MPQALGPAPDVVYRWLEPPNSDGWGVILIKDKAYHFSCITEGGKIVGYRLIRSNAKVYDIDITYPDAWTCDCPDFTMRRSYDPHKSGPCKHCIAIRDGLADVKGRFF